MRTSSVAAVEPRSATAGAGRRHCAPMGRSDRRDDHVVVLVDDHGLNDHA